MTGMKTLKGMILAAMLPLLSAPKAGAVSLVASNPLEYVALAEGYELLNSAIQEEMSFQTKTALLQNTIAAEFTQIKKWEGKYNSYLKTASGYASSLKACTSLYNDGVRMIMNLAQIKSAITHNPQGIVASMSMNNLYIETVTELVSIYNLLQDAVATGGTGNMLDGAERSKILWMLSDRLGSFNRKLTSLALSIRYYTMTDVWNAATAGIVEKSNKQLAEASLESWKRRVSALAV